ncbi:hypothetical protein BD410DRAFT_846930 [Rickenella mellea]|uniref:Uncharacterized protein n=1 Tax=Rickenella mellea TaxID=50990 RepID=A0A4Y7PGI0_9AGAM|nr:hypothetical protein BD410DRAFT_846930 [Rickenella mellea]
MGDEDELRLLMDYSPARPSGDPQELNLYDVSRRIEENIDYFDYGVSANFQDTPFFINNCKPSTSTNNWDDWEDPNLPSSSDYGGIDVPMFEAGYAESSSNPRFVGYAETDAFLYPEDYNIHLPRYRQCQYHPLWIVSGGRAFVYEYDVSPAKQQAQFEWAAGLKVPLGHSETELWQDKWIELRPGDAIFVREKGTTNALFDVVKAYVKGPESLNSLILDKMKAVTRKILGPQKDRTLNKPTIINGVKTGGIYFERNPDLVHGAQGSRCYSTAVSIQAPRDGLGQPCHNVAGDGEYENLTREFNYASAAVAAAALKEGPAERTEKCRTRSDILNLPEIGDPSNEGYVSNCQVNVAPSVLETSRSDMSGSLGNAGVSHFDTLDDGLGLTAIFAISDIPVDYDPGKLFLLEQNAYVVLKNYTVLVFSGLHRHGGSPPRAPVGAASVEPWALRVTVIWYPSRTFLNRNGNTSLAYTEEFGAVENSTKGTGWRPTFAGCGLNLMQESSLRTYVVREIYYLIHSILATCPPSLHLDIDATAFFASLSFTDSDGTIQPIPPWPHAPGGPQDDERAVLLKDVEEYTAHVTSFIPLVAARLVRNANSEQSFLFICDFIHSITA